MLLKTKSAGKLGLRLNVRDPYPPLAVTGTTFRLSTLRIAVTVLIARTELTGGGSLTIILCGLLLVTP